MLTPVERKYFYEIGLTCRRLGWKVCDETRHAIGRAALGEFKSHKVFTAGDYDRVFKKLIELRNPNNISAVMDVLAFVNHDVAQARHLPVVKPGKPKRKYGSGGKPALRRYPSQYEMTTEVDDPGARKRRIYVIERLFAPALVDKVCFDRWQVRDWRELDLPQLTELRDLLKARLGKFITKVKAGKIDYDFGFSFFNPQTGRVFPNEAVIAILLRRGVRVDMRDNRSHRDRAPLKANDHDARPVCNSGGHTDSSTARAVEVPF
jgi:hypothetical protein